MKLATTAGCTILLVLMHALPALAQSNGIASVESRHSVKVSIDRLDSLVRLQGITVFCRIDFAADARTAGLELPPKQLLLFGNPKAGTPLMQASPVVALDLPLKVLAWEDPRGKVWLSYNTPEYIKVRHRLPEELVKNIIGVETLVEKAAE